MKRHQIFIIRDFGELENYRYQKRDQRILLLKQIEEEKIFIDELSKSKKNYSFITEETGKISKKDNKTSLIIDPIDGTTNFLHGIPHFAISIALQNDGEIIIGLIFDPIKNEVFYAEKVMVHLLTIIELGFQTSQT